ncbi:MAG: HAMP domain-containing histidine kinase, partial [Coleofasciculus sp. S288]|nr:HAMP domain-containing histidine kinase [Coleofasciculus sp. S288]
RQVLAASRYQTLLNQLSSAIRSDLSLDEILQMAIANTARSLQVNRGLLLLLNNTESIFNSQPLKHLPNTEVRVVCEWIAQAQGQAVQGAGRANRLLNHSFSLAESSLCQQALKHAPEPLVIAEERDTSPRNQPSERLPLFEREMRSAGIMVPLVGPHTDSSSATILGFLVFQPPQLRSWHNDELQLVMWVSTQVSATLLQNQSLQQVQSLVEERTAQLQRSLQVQAKLYEKTRQQIDQLQQLNQLKEEFLSSMSHELRTPLTTMCLAIRMLRQANLPVERREKYLEILEQQCNQEIDLINDLLSLQRLESNQAYIQPHKISLMSLIKELAQSFEEKWADKRLTLRVDCPERLMFNTDPDSLHRILLELLTNAGKYSDPDTTVHLQVTPQVQRSVNQVVIRLSNQGPGISPMDLHHIFDKFRRGQGVTKKAVQGTGLGLALVKCLVQHLNGTIDVESCPCENSSSSLISFTLTLPQFLQQQQSLNQELIP